jgi:hypothetical protein
MINIPATSNSTPTWPAGWAYQDPGCNASGLSEDVVSAASHSRNRGLSASRADVVYSKTGAAQNGI